MDGNKRSFPRFSFSEPVAYGIPELTVHGSIAGNISLSGILLKVQEFVPVNTTLELQIRLDQSPRVVWVRAQVVRVRELSSDDCYEIGLQFVRDEACTKAIGKYINTVYQM